QNPQTLLQPAPATIALWSFDETTGLWKEEGTATKTGSNYIALVHHFSYWNCDMPFTGGVNFQAQLTDSNLHPLVNADVWITTGTGGFTGCHGYTDSAGFVCGFVPANSTLQLLTSSSAPCYNPIYTKDFTTTNDDINLG